MVYLYHLETPIKSLSGQKKKYASHYIGSTQDMYQRDAEHRNDNSSSGWKRQGSNFLWNCNIRGIRYHLVRTWKAESKGACRVLEKQLKARRKYCSLCPVCRGIIDIPTSNVLER